MGFHFFLNKTHQPSVVKTIKALIYKLLIIISSFFSFLHQFVITSFVCKSSSFRIDDTLLLLNFLFFFFLLRAFLIVSFWCAHSLIDLFLESLWGVPCTEFQHVDDPCLGYYWKEIFFIFVSRRIQRIL